MKILIRNLSPFTTEAKLQELLSQFGAVQYCNLVLDKDTGGSKGFAFAEMPKVGEAKAAIKALNNRDLDGARLRVKRAQDNKQASNISAPDGENRA